MADDTSGTAFGQQVPPLSVYLKRVLEKYPEGGQILKELLQNADDAKARKVIFLYDKTEHSCDGLWSEKLSEFQGPALYAYNDAVFKDVDWDSIQKPEQSDKVDDVMKVGRFGLGFISVYHLTGEVIDPQRRTTYHFKTFKRSSNPEINTNAVKGSNNWLSNLIGRERGVGNQGT